MEIISNPFRPGAGQKPPYLAGRDTEQRTFSKLLNQRPVIKNLIITGLRGVGKTSLLDSLQPMALQAGWLWAGTDLSEAASLNEKNLIMRITTDLSSVTSHFSVGSWQEPKIGFTESNSKIDIKANFQFLWQIYNNTHGLEADKLKAVLENVWHIVRGHVKGIILAYDEAQLLKDHNKDKEFPLSLLLEVTQYLQRKEIPFMLVLAGLPTLFPNLVDTRTYAERMFRVLHLDKLSNDECKDAILKPTEVEECKVRFSESAVKNITKYSGGYPYFIQFLCKETFDSYILQLKLGNTEPSIYLEDIIRKLDTDFYSGRWAKLTDSQKNLMIIISELANADNEFTVQEISEKSKIMGPPQRPLSTSNINQLLNKLAESGLVYKLRHGKYSFAVPMLSAYIKRQQELFNDEEF